VADLDGDGDLDLFLAGRDTLGEEYTKLLINNVNIPNQKPVILSTPTVSQDSETGNITIEMPTASDAETPSDGLTFTMQIGILQGEYSTMPGNIRNDSTYMITRPGNIGHANTWILKGLPLGRYYFGIWEIGRASCRERV